MSERRNDRKALHAEKTEGVFRHPKVHGYEQGVAKPSWAPPPKEFCCCDRQGEGSLSALEANDGKCRNFSIFFSRRGFFGAALSSARARATFFSALVAQQRGGGLHHLAKLKAQAQHGKHPPRNTVPRGHQEPKQVLGSNYAWREKALHRDVFNA